MALEISSGSQGFKARKWILEVIRLKIAYPASEWKARASAADFLCCVDWLYGARGNNQCLLIVQTSYMRCSPLSRRPSWLPSNSWGDIVSEDLN